MGVGLDGPYHRPVDGYCELRKTRAESHSWTSDYLADAMDAASLTVCPPIRGSLADRGA